MKTLFLSFIFVLLSLSLSTKVYSQGKWVAEFKPGLNFPISDEEIKTGYGFGLSLGYNFMPHLGAYAGWGWNQFKWEDDQSNAIEIDLEETGYNFGLQFIHPFSNSSNISYLVRFGGIYNHIEIEDNNGDISEDSGHGLGWEAGAGLELGLGMKWFLRPQIGYRSLTREMRIGPLSRDFDLQYLSLQVGIAKKF